MVRIKNKDACCAVIADADKLRLEKYAPLFGVTFTANPDGTHTLAVHDAGGPRTATVTSALAHFRLLAEVCEKIVPWVYFSAKEHCAKTLFSLSDNKVMRLSQLYRQAQHRTTP